MWTISRKSHPRSSKLLCRIEVSAFAAILFALLFMLMADTNPHYHSYGMSVDLAKSDHSIPMSGASADDALIVAIDRSGHIFLVTTRIRTADLSVKIKAALKGGAERKVYIKADARVHYASVSAVLDEVRAAGVERIGLLTQQPR